MKVSIIVPVYNEEENIGLLYEEVEKSVKTMGIPWELILVDDGRPQTRQCGDPAEKFRANSSYRGRNRSF